MSVRDCMLVAVLMLTLTVSGKSERILGFFPFPAKSHVISFSALMRELAARGHEVTVVSAFPEGRPLANYTDIVVQDTFPEKELMNPFEVAMSDWFTMLTFFWDLGIMACERAIIDPSIQKLIHDKELKFDLIIIEGLLGECMLGIIHKFKAPVVQISANTKMVVMGTHVGNPHFFSYVPDVFTEYCSPMSFLDRMGNALHGTLHILSRQLYYLPRMEAIMRKHFTDPDLPTIPQLEMNTSFLLLNSHVIFNGPRPYTPNTAEVGGMHIKPPKKLPKDLQKFLDEAPDGVIYFSMGSIIRSSVMPEDKRDALLQAFAKLKQRVLWKWETDVLPGQTDNVRLGKWLPQSDILGHPNVKVFMTHGGLLSTQEAVYHGVPVLAIPIFTDQIITAAHAEKAGIGIVLNFQNVTSISVSWALDQLIHQPSYQENVNHLSAIFHDQPEKPMDRAVYWSEYVMRHKGAPHMRSAALDLTWYQYHLLDVIGVLVGGIAVGLAMVCLICRAAFRRIMSRKSQMTTSKKIN